MWGSSVTWAGQETNDFLWPKFMYGFQVTQKGRSQATITVPKLDQCKTPCTENSSKA